MRNEAWPAFSFTEALSPPDGWKTDCAIFGTYSADLVVVVTVLLALTGCDLDNRHKGSRVELVKAIEALRGKVCILAQAGRVSLSSPPRPILKLLDKFLKTVDADESVGSWHPKMCLVRYNNIEDLDDYQWRLWIGSRNLTRALNWETGLTLTSRSDGKGHHIEGLAATGEALARRAKLVNFSPAAIGAELAGLTWDCPPGSEVHRLDFIGPGLRKGYPTPPSDSERVFVVSPFLDLSTVRELSRWGGAKARRTLVSTAMELQRLFREDDAVFDAFENVRMHQVPELVGEGADIRDQEANGAVEAAESEELEPAGLHAKLYFAAQGPRRQLWLGSANATVRAWQGRNFEIVAELSISRDVAEAIDEFVAIHSQQFVAGSQSPPIDEDEEALESARRALSCQWPLRQRIADQELEIIAAGPPPIPDVSIDIEIAALDGTWTTWPRSANRISLPGLRRWQRSDFVQLRVMRGERSCSWVQVAPCEPPPDEERDHALIAQYLDPKTFLIWLRSILTDEPARAAGGDWDAEWSSPVPSIGVVPGIWDVGLMPTVEEILRSWARDSSAFCAADKKVQTYLVELERRAQENAAVADVDLLKAFRQTWSALASELG
jgi:hypothetical protein